MKKPEDSTHRLDGRNAPLTADVFSSRGQVPTQTEASATVSMSSSPKLSAPLFNRKGKSGGEAKAGIDKTAVANETVKGKNTVNERNDKEKVGETHQVAAHHPQSIALSVKSANKQEVNKVEASMAQPSRPSNPFLKSSIK